MKGELKRRTMMKRNKHKLGKNLSSTVQKLLRKEKKNRNAIQAAGEEGRS